MVSSLVDMEIVMDDVDNLCLNVAEFGVWVIGE
jgi:hypothetical protein